MNRMRTKLRETFSICFPPDVSLLPLSRPVNNGTESLSVVTHLYYSGNFLFADPSVFPAVGQVESRLVLQ